MTANTATIWRPGTPDRTAAPLAKLAHVPDGDDIKCVLSAFALELTTAAEMGVMRTPPMHDRWFETICDRAYAADAAGEITLPEHRAIDTQLELRRQRRRRERG